jgi:phage shock protein A
MALMLSRLYDALRLANVPEDKAREAAEEVATYEQVKSDTYLLKWMVGVLIAIVLGVFWMQWQTIARMGELQGGLSGVQASLTNVQSQLLEMNGQFSGVESRLGNVENRLTSVDDRLSRVETRLDGTGGEGPQR